MTKKEREKISRRIKVKLTKNPYVRQADISIDGVHTVTLHQWKQYANSTRYMQEVAVNATIPTYIQDLPAVIVALERAEEIGAKWRKEAVTGTPELAGVN